MIDIASGVHCTREDLCRASCERTHLCSCTDLQGPCALLLAIAKNTDKACDQLPHTAGLGKIWSIAGTVGALLSAGAAVGLWALLTNSYRLDRQMVIRQVAKHVTEADLAAVNAAPALSEMPDMPIRRNSTLNPILDSSSMDIGLIGSAVDATRNMTREGNMGANEDIRAAATQITKRCLQRWDGFMALRADSDSLGRRTGIWKTKFDGVRCAAMLLAMRLYNEGLQDSHAGESHESSRTLCLGINVQHP